MRLELANPALADEFVVFLDEAGFAADPAGVLKAAWDDLEARLLLDRHLAVWNALHPDALVVIED
jgi:hypothetical protein